jgi:hypothetical protein
MEIATFIPKPRLIVGVLITIVLLAIALRAMGMSDYGVKIRTFLGIHPG